MSRKRPKSSARRPPPPPDPIVAPVSDVEPETVDVLSPALKDPSVWAGTALVVVTVVVFAAVRQFDFIGMDDPGYVRDNVHVNRGLSWAGLVWAWTTGHAANWHPLTWMSHMLDAELFGVRPGGHHTTSVVFHVINVVLLFVLLKRSTGAVALSAIAAALFAIHPLHVESVAWISERKDVLSTMFWLLAMLAYVEYVRRPRWTRYLLVFVLMALGLMAKPMLVSLPIALLLFDIWPLRRLAEGRPLSSLVLEKLPFVALSIASSVVTLIVQRQGGAVSDLGVLPVWSRVANALVAYLRYLGKTVWPRDLTLFYPYNDALPTWWVAGSALALVVISVVAVRTLRRHPYVFVGWFWYVVTLVPVIGLVQVGTQAIADRYTYVPLIGIFVGAIWGVASIVDRRPAWRWSAAGLAVAIVAGLAVVAHAQVQVWENNRTVWTHARAVTERNYIAENEVGIELVKQGKHDEALPHFEQSSRYRPEYVEARNNLGLAYSRLGRVQDAIDQFTLAVRLKPDHAEAFNHLGFVQLGAGKPEDAMASFREAVRIKPDLVDARNNLGFVLAAAGRVDEAIPQFEAAVRLAPDVVTGHAYLGMAYGAAGKLAEALREFREVQRIRPGPETQAQIEKLEAEIKRRAAGGR
jgi:Flp pilus assembly protein TadD